MCVTRLDSSIPDKLTNKRRVKLNVTDTSLLCSSVERKQRKYGSFPSFAVGKIPRRNIRQPADSLNRGE